MVYSCNRDQVKQAKGQMECWIANRSHSRLEGSGPVGWKNDGFWFHKETLQITHGLLVWYMALGKVKKIIFQNLINTLVWQDILCRLCKAASSQTSLTAAWRVPAEAWQRQRKNSSHSWEGNHSHHLRAGVQTHCESALSGREPMSTEVNENNQHRSPTAHTQPER